MCSIAQSTGLKLDPLQQEVLDLQWVEEEDRSVLMDGINPYPCPLHHPAAFASLPLVPSVKALLSFLAMPPVSSTMQVVLEDGVEVGGEVAAVMAVEVQGHTVWPF